MKVVELDMTVSVAQALAEWDGAGDQCSKARRDALYRRWQILRSVEANATPEPVSYIEGATGPKRSIMEAPERPALPASLVIKIPKAEPKPAPKPKTSNPMSNPMSKPVPFTASECQTIAKRIRQACSELGYEKFGGTAALAERLKISGPSISQARTGGYVSRAALPRFAAVGVSARWLETGEGPMLLEKEKVVRFEGPSAPAKAKPVKAKERAPKKPGPKASKTLPNSLMHGQALRFTVPDVAAQLRFDDVLAALQDALRRRAEIDAVIKNHCARIAALS